MLTEKHDKRLPFSVDRNRPEPLISQVAVGLGRAIETGFYPAGTVLPTLVELSEGLGVSMIVVRAAMRRLVREGLVNPRPGLGTVVLSHATRLWRGNVVIVSAELRDNIFNATLSGILRGCLVEAGYLPSQVAVIPDGAGGWDFGPLDVVLRFPTSLVVSLTHEPSILGHLADKDVPVVTVSSDSGRALADFAAACTEAGVRRALAVRFPGNEAAWPAAALAQAGVAVEEAVLAEAEGLSSIERVQRATGAAFARRLSEGRDLPDLLYFNDDYAAAAAMTELLRHGVRIPADVGVVTWASRGNVPYCGCELSRIETNPYEGGRRLAEAVLARLADPAAPDVVTVELTFFRGETLAAR